MANPPTHVNREKAANARVQSRRAILSAAGPNKIAESARVRLICAIISAIDPNEMASSARPEYLANDLI